MPKHIFTEKEKEEIIYKYTVEKMGSHPLAAQYNCSAPTLLKNLKEWGISPNNKKLDLTGKKFGKLTVIKPAPKRKDRYTRWVCLCTCGKETEVRTDYLTSGHTTSCGCVKAEYIYLKDLVGQRFGKLTVIKNAPPMKKVCQCDCGNIIEIETNNLLTGNTQSCGCLKSKGELKINTLLNDLNISFKTQYSFNDCRFKDTNRMAYFDYAIFNKNNKLIALIEYDGIQHYKGWGYNKDSLQVIQKHDLLKNEYCKRNKIPLIRIPYSDYDKLNKEYLKKLIDEAQEIENV